MNKSVDELIKQNDNASLKDLLLRHPEFANGKTEQGLSYLQLATYYKNNEAIRLICERKKSIDLYEASGIGDLELVKAWLAMNRELIDTPSVDGFTALGLACYFGHIEIARFLIEVGANVNLPSSNTFRVTPLHSAAAISSYEIAALLLENGADVNARQQSGVTPLHSAAHNGQTNLAELLIDNGADVNARTDAGKTPLDMATEKDFTETARLIQSRA